MVKYTATIEKEKEKYIYAITDVNLFNRERDSLEYLLACVNEGFTLTITLYNEKD